MISEETLLSMERDADKAKAELHLGTHIRALTVEVRELSSGARKRPTQEQVQVALSVLAMKDTPMPLADKARDVIERFLA